MEIKECYVAIDVEDMPKKNGFYLCINPNQFGQDKNTSLRYDTYNNTWFNDNDDCEHPTHWLEKQTLYTLTKEEWEKMQQLIRYAWFNGFWNCEEGRNADEKYEEFKRENNLSM